MKAYKIRFETDKDIPVFKRLHYEEVDVPLKDIIQRGIHPESMNHEPSCRELASLRNHIQELLNDAQHKLPDLTGLGYGEDIKESIYYYSYQDITSCLKRIANNTIFVEDLNYPKLVELATQRLIPSCVHRSNTIFYFISEK